MKTKFLAFPLLAALALTGCSNDIGSDEPVNGGEANYLAVNIVTPKESAIGRATTDGGFEQGTDDENKAEKGYFLVFDAAGKQTQTPVSKNLTFGETGSYNPNVERVSDAVLVIENAQNVNPVEVMVVLNAPEDMNLAGKTKTAVLEEIGAYNGQTSGTFVMTNSVYKDGGKGVCATSITGHLADNEVAAKGNPVDIYVERVLAKVTTSKISGNTDASEDMVINSTEIPVGEETIKLVPVVKGIEIANIADKSYLFKNIAGINYSWNWSDAANKRSYWAVSPAEGLINYINASYNGITDDPVNAHTFYVQENTTDTKTSVLVTAELRKANADGTASDETVTVVWHAGKYYSETGFKNYIAEVLYNQGYRIETTADESKTYASIGTDKLSWITSRPAGVEMKGYEAAMMVSGVIAADEAGKRLVRYDAVTQTYASASEAEINSYLLLQSNRPWVWKDGKAYYFVEIEHFGTDAENKNLKGIVRNHVYKLQLQELKGLGVPVFLPEEIIIPEKPKDDSFYLAAQINILKWKVVAQKIVFE